MNYKDIQPDLMVYTRARGEIPLAPGEHVGTVDHLDGGAYVKLKKSDSPDGRHHWFPITWVERIDQGVVYLNKTLEEFERDLIDEDPKYKPGTAA